MGGNNVCVRRSNYQQPDNGSILTTNCSTVYLTQTRNLAQVLRVYQGVRDKEGKLPNGVCVFWRENWFFVDDDSKNVQSETREAM